MTYPAKQFARVLEGTMREDEPTFTLDRQIERARKDMGERRWQQLNKEWDA